MSKGDDGFMGDAGVKLQWNGIKIFSATKSADRERLGERMNEWSKVNPSVEIVEARVLQSSDNAFHCLTIVAFWRKRSL